MPCRSHLLIKTATIPCCLLCYNASHIISMIFIPINIALGPLLSQIQVKPNLFSYEPMSQAQFFKEFTNQAGKMVQCLRTVVPPEDQMIVYNSSSRYKPILFVHCPSSCLKKGLSYYISNVLLFNYSISISMYVFQSQGI